ncbi:MAG: carboxylating nicotinate-nucleotide diphosphorylase [Methanobacteriaceae archaeon]|jgi:nicotinate-nucleotide pyrophosphorylase (carboxylating)|nr:carboxylating nicotinate-nucleotide diphosphorylase [Candidatus Methanorudis spinitermitis]
MDKIIKHMIDEDIGFSDITTDALIPPEKIAKAKIISKTTGIIAGVKVATSIFKEYGLEITAFKEDGDKIIPRDVILEINGLAKDILSLERTALNLIMRMSGIATITSKMILKIKNTGVNTKIAGTRKTSPSLHKFDKMAIAIGGGDTHRFRLDDMVLIKDNHIAIVGSVSKAIELAREKSSFSKKIEIEVETTEDAIIASNLGADIIMLDNMVPNEIKKTISVLEKQNLRENVLIEVSGGINENNILEYAKSGVDIISLGFITHSVDSLDISLIFEL